MTVDGRTSAVVPADPDTVFRTVTDIDRLPSWNPVMTAVIERPEVLEASAQWVVEFHALGQTWHSRSTVEEVDPDGRRFAYRSRTDDGNLSEARWTWEVTEDSRWESGHGHVVAAAGHVLAARCSFDPRQLARTEVPAPPR